VEYRSGIVTAIATKSNRLQFVPRVFGVEMFGLLAESPIVFGKGIHDVIPFFVRVK